MKGLHVFPCLLSVFSKDLVHRFDIHFMSWFKDAVSRRINITGPLLQTKALAFAQSLGITDFKASKGWLESFKQRNNIAYGSMSGERGDVNLTCVNDWKSKLADLCRGYDAKNILNMDETGLFFRDTSRKTFHFKGDDCAGGKRSKERVTVALCASLSGEKMKPLLIGKSHEPRCFKKIKTKSLPVHYYFNKKAWMTGQIYEDYLKTLNKQMKSEDRRVLLFVDNAPSHPAVQLSHVKVAYLPPNTTSYTQPMDQGIIQAMKLKFRKRQLLHMVKEMDRQPTVSGPELLKRVNVLDTIYWVHSSWEEVEESTVQKCFHKAGFFNDHELGVFNHPHIDSEVSETETQNTDDEDDDDDIPLSVLKLSYDLYGCSFTKLVDSDSSVHTCETNAIDWNRPASDLLKDLDTDVQDNSDLESDCDESVDQEEIPSLHEIVEMLPKLKSFFLQKGHSDVLPAISKIDDKLNLLVADKKQQSKITEFFSGDRRDK